MSNDYIYYYTREKRDDDPSHHIKFTTTWNIFKNFWCAATDAGEHDYHECEGYLIDECYPCEFYFYDSEHKYIGMSTVRIEMEPSIYVDCEEIIKPKEKKS